jgi:trk system potassium uptake protein TrkH
MLNYKFILKILGILVVLEGIIMIVPLLVSLLSGGADTNAFLISLAITIISGLIFYLPFHKTKKNIGKREGYILIILTFVFFSLFGSLPFIFSESKFSFTDSFFETMSGITTTGASVIPNVEILSKGLLFWRSFTQWLGGMGIIIMSLSVLPFLGITGLSLISSESSDVNIDRINPKIKDTILIVLVIYLILTSLETILLTVGGMDFFDSLCHSFSTISTGGFSTHNNSLGNWSSPFIQYVVIFFMILSGMNFSLLYLGFSNSLKKIFKNEELKIYLAFIILITAIVAIGWIYISNIGIEDAIRKSLFQITSLLSSTGFYITEYKFWNEIIFVVFFIILFIGGATGSASGGVKLMRFVIIIKGAYNELLRLLHPNAVIPIRCNTKSVTLSTLSNILIFCLIYILIFLIGSLILMIAGVDLFSAMGSAASCLGNIGPGIGVIAPFDTYIHLSVFSKWVLSFIMLIGRLEVFVVISLFFSVFWKR